MAASSEVALPLMMFKTSEWKRLISMKKGSVEVF